MNKNRVAAKTVMTILALALLSSAGALVSPLAYADEGGVSFWFPGQYGSLAAMPAEPGWSLPLIYYHIPGRRRQQGIYERRQHQVGFG